MSTARDAFFSPRTRRARRGPPSFLPGRDEHGAGRLLFFSVRKLHDYASIGVPEYWLIDAEARTLERLVLRENVYSIVEALEGDAVLRPESFEGLEIPLARLWDDGEAE